MKKALFLLAFAMGATSLSAQYYGTTTKRSNGYSSNQNYSGSYGTTTVNTNRDYTGSGGYNSNTNVYRDGSLRSSSSTYSSPYSGSTTTNSYNYNTGRTTTTTTTRNPYTGQTTRSRSSY